MAQRPPSGPSDSVRDHVAAVMNRASEHAAAQVLARQAPPPPRSRLYLLGLLSPVLLAVVVWNVAAFTRKPDVFTPGEEEQNAKVAIYIAASAILEYRAETGRLPTSLAAVDLDPEELTFTPEGDGFQLTARIGDQVVTWRSLESLEPYGDAYATLQGGTP